ncbi:class I SAM-dependent methyltransferase [Kiloniella sp.]|uniref:class I SAM-dependent methyltransferase n=1 Tax=Kiloniella sp. TaxID=1938587 RepID=UPI003A952745
MTKQNNTLAYYEKNAKAYADRDFLGTFGEYRDLFVTTVKVEFQKTVSSKKTVLPKPKALLKANDTHKPRVLELGSGSGRDAQAFMSCGFDVTLVDGAEQLAQIAKQRTGQDVLVIDFEDLAFETEFDGVWAAASLLHVPSLKLPDVLKSVERSLRNTGVLVASFKESDHDWVDDLGRYFCAMTENHLAELIVNSGFELLTIEKRDGQGSDGKPTVWLWIVAQKKRCLVKNADDKEVGKLVLSTFG